MIEAKPLSPEEYPLWDRFVEASPDAWFWHTTAWMRYTKEYARDSFRHNASFWIVDGSERLAAAPVFVESAGNQARLAYAGSPLPAPAINPALSAKKRQQVMQFLLAHLSKLMEESSVRHFQIRIPALAPAVMSSGTALANPFIRLGCLDLPYQTQVLDLTPDLSALWGSIRHGHQYDIRRGEKSLQSCFWSGNELTDEKFSEYQQLHAKDAGRVTRSQSTFDLMKEWVRNGNGGLVEASHNGKAVAFALIIIYKDGAYYGSAAKDPDHADMPSSHLIQWIAIQRLKERGIRFYDIGIQQFGTQWFDEPTAKDMDISKFKRGFGGVTAPLFTAEFHRTPEDMRDAIERRLDKFLPRASVARTPKAAPESVP